MFSLESGTGSNHQGDPRRIKEVLHINDVASKKSKMIGKPKTVKTFSNFISNDTELMQESATQMILIMPKDIFESNDDLKTFFEEGAAEVINILQKQLAALKIVGQTGGIVKENCKGKISKNTKYILTNNYRRRLRNSKLSNLRWKHDNGKNPRIQLDSHLSTSRLHLYRR